MSYLIISFLDIKSNVQIAYELRYAKSFGDTITVVAAYSLEYALSKATLQPSLST